MPLPLRFGKRKRRSASHRTMSICSAVSATTIPPLALTANPQEVDAIYEISLERVFQARSYRLTYRQKDRGHYSFHEQEVRIAGPTVSIMIGLYEALAAFIERDA